MIDAPLVSVVICAYNAGRYLLPAIQSILNQTYPHLEVLVVDDGSTDGSVEAARCRINDSRMRWFQQRNAGKPTALNWAMQEMTGDFYAIQDADDLSAPQRIERELRCMRDNPDVAAVFCGHELIFNSRHVAPRFRAKDRAACAHDIAAFRMPAHDPTAMYRCSSVRDIKYEPSLLIGQGYDYVLRVGERHPMLVLGECLYAYRVQRESVTRRNPGRRGEMVRNVLRMAHARRGIAFCSDIEPHTPGMRSGSAGDNNIAADFMESVVDLRSIGRFRDAISTGLRCIALQPRDPHYYKALLYAILPAAVRRRVRPSERPRSIPLVVSAPASSSNNSRSI